MDYIQKVKEEFWDMNMFQAWDIVDRRVTKAQGGDIEYITLHHPCNMKRELLKELIPPSYDIDEILESVNIRQKEIARRLNISKLPSDRPSGWLGQTALFEVLRDRGFDFKSYLADELRMLVETSMKENDVNGDIHLIQSWSYGQPGSILQLATRK